MRSIKFFVALFLVGVLLTGCASGGSNDTGNEEEKVYQAGTDAQFPPFEKLEGDGSVTGFDAEILDAIAQAAGIKVNLQHTGWDPMFEGIDRGKLDLAIAAITITEDRKQKYDFTDPYFEAKQMILVPKDVNISSLKELNGKKIGVQSATTGELVVQDAFGKTYEGLKGYEDLPSAIEDLKLGRLDAVVADEAVIIEFAKKMDTSKFQMVKDDTLTTEHYGILVKKGNQELLNKLNEGLKKIKEDGTYDRIYAKYFSIEEKSE